MSRTLPVVDASIRLHMDMLIADGCLGPVDSSVLAELRQKARHGVDYLTAAEVAWVTMLIAKRAALSVSGVLP